MPRWQWLMAQLTRQLWVRATLIGALGVLAAILAAVVERYIPWQLPWDVGSEAVDSLLTIIASSMLTVTTFSLSIMVSAYGSATNNVTPRATRLLIEDRLTQTVLSTFIGSFLFGIVGLIVLKIGAYGERGRVVLFVVTIAVIVLVVVSLLRWIDHLTRLGRVGETTDRVEDATRQAIEARLRHPYLGGTPLHETDDVPKSARHVDTERIGYVQHIDMQALERSCKERDVDVFIHAVPGAFVYPNTPLAYVDGPAKQHGDEPLVEVIANAFTIGADRSFDQDPRFGLAVMSEIGSRALSPATNDAGTAIDVIGRTTRLMSLWATGRKNGGEEEPKYPHVHVPALRAGDMFEDGFMLIARDGAGLIEVQLRIQKALLALARLGDDDFRQSALTQSQLALARAESALQLEADKARLRHAVEANQAERGVGDAGRDR